jgi:hypothetical protein
MLFDASDRTPPCWPSGLKTPVSPAGAFPFLRLRLYAPATARRAPTELIDGCTAGVPVRKLIFRAALAIRMPFARDRPDHRAGVKLATIARVVLRKRRPTSNVASMMVVRARRVGTGSKYVTLRGRLRRVIPFLLIRSWCRCGRTQLYVG